ncbi:MAG: Uncharacterized protein XD67_1296 [Thermodesulfobacterium commune]|jgi:ABC-type ATPase with predicted acetyltransferase domain|nr:MAG: Uncharacterized protein XD67_1296 [Thermodesulfobacterium commune]MDK2861439.1 hypothetical protein [Thermodesulfobacterium sp.]
MGLWKCSNCGEIKESRCKPKKCPKCGEMNTMVKEGTEANSSSSCEPKKRGCKKKAG